MNRYKWKDDRADEEEAYRLAFGSARRQREVDWVNSEQGVDILSGTILQHKFSQNVYLIQANTLFGAYAFTGTTTVSFMYPAFSQLGQVFNRPVFHGWSGDPPADILDITDVEQIQTEDVPAAEAQPDFTAESVLAKLRAGDLNLADRRQLIIQAEVLAFTPVQAEELKGSLRNFIRQHRDASEQADRVAVGSAVRKFVALTNAEQLSTIVFILDHDGRSPPPPEVELEVAKMVVRKLTAALPERPDAHPELGNRLADLVSAYLNPRLLPRQYFGAATLNSVLALALMRSQHLAELVASLRALRLSWFKQQLARRAQLLRDDLAGRFPPERNAPQMENLAGLIEALQWAGV